MNTLRNPLKRLVVGLAAGATLTIAAPATAQESDPFLETSGAYIAELVAELAIIAQETEDDEARARQLRDALSDDLAVEAMARFTLSAELREGAPPDVLARYDALFPDYMATAFASQIELLARQTIEVRDTRRIRDDEVVVRTEILNAQGRDAATLLWRLREVDEQPKVLDVLVERMSRLVGLRAEFRSIVERDGLAALVDRMQEVVNALATDPPDSSDENPAP